jgi:light-regulated signal transduction histidine kinase (bacteriophytochrome)
VRADATQLSQVFQNLIANALKFRGSATPKIYIDACREDDHWLFSVRDNGIGFDPKHRERIFQVFQRLHTQRQYPGTGIGLAICKRIVDRHDGQIWVESQPGHGSTFYFTIPERITRHTPHSHRGRRISSDVLRANPEVRS